MTLSAASAPGSELRMLSRERPGTEDLRARREAVMAAARQRSGFMHWAHVGAGVFYLASLGFSSNAAVWGFGLLAVVALARSPFTIRTYWYLLNDWVGWLIIVWAAVSGLAILWSPDQMQGVVEWRPFRALFTAMMLWPVVNYAPLFVAGFLVGVLGQNIAQLGQGLGIFEIPLGDGPRLRGMTHPVNTGTLCLIAMCWHISAIMTARGWWRWLSVVGLVAAGIGMVFTGSRGPWIAAAIVLPACVIGIAWRFPAARRIALVAIVGAVVMAAASWPFVQDIVEYRLEMTQEDVAHVEQGTVEQELGLSYRLACWEAAWETFLAHPLGGIGAGGYHVAANESSRGDDLANAPHAHSLYFHVLASTGLLGMIVLLAVIAGALHRAWHERWDHPYAAGTFYAILGWLLAGLFDAVHLNGQMLGVFAAMVTITLPTRPAANVGRKEALKEQEV